MIILLNFQVSCVSVASELFHTVPGHLLGIDHAGACLCGRTDGLCFERAIRCGTQELTLHHHQFPLYI